ncbi:hypothetical protein L1887_02761 [Cichorium endivia]|nr:hypothetical protein L1887_02761 [Cichorium endivia]
MTMDRSTRFNGDFYWKAKTASFIVFDYKTSRNYCEKNQEEAASGTDEDDRKEVDGSKKQSYLGRFGENCKIFCERRRRWLLLRDVGKDTVTHQMEAAGEADRQDGEASRYLYLGALFHSKIIEIGLVREEENIETEDIRVGPFDGECRERAGVRDGEKEGGSKDARDGGQNIVEFDVVEVHDT